MKLALLEWTCGGGLAGTTSDLIPDHRNGSLCHEGWAMLLSLARGFSSGNVRITTATDAVVISPSQRRVLAEVAGLVEVTPSDTAELLQAWLEIAASCDWTLVIAPEIDNALLDVTNQLRSEGIRLLNCSPELISTASDKALVARRFEHAAIPHPPTRRLTDVDGPWLSATRPLASSLQQKPRWVIKPGDGAGCEHLQVVDETELIRQIGDADSRSAGMLTQPWLSGRALSCSAIVDTEGHLHWLPLVSQDFHMENAGDNLQLKYIGGRLQTNLSVGTPGAMQSELRELLEAATRVLGANNQNSAPAAGNLGWISFDLLHDEPTGRWTIVECNPRCTSSLLGLTEAYSGNLAMEMLWAANGNWNGLRGSWARALRWRC